MQAGDIVRRGNKLWTAGREVDAAGRRKFWAMHGPRRALYFRPSGFVATGYNIHTNNPFVIDSPV